MLNFIHFPPICVNQKKSEKIYFTIYFGQERIFTCQIMSVLLSWKLIRKTWNECAAGNCKKEPSVGWPMDQGWDNIRKVSRPFPMSPFFFFSCLLLTIVHSPYLISPLSTVDTILFAYFILTCFMPQACWNCWNLLSFIGLETGHRRGPEKRSVIDVATSIIDGIDTGVNFLLLWGKKRALKLRTGPTG